ncbi:VOC family protein [Nocardia jejuensis]|uniref:VOC family protein n=1 Tax=Nocardia jejuensis TaxID=328049 RepID=UPI0008343B97|nr:VOC family protein [Nocardia jejuensis]
MSISTVTHLNFTGEARAALAFYQQVFGGELSLATYGDFGLPKELPDADRVVFGRVVADNGFEIMAYDVPTHPDAVAAAPFSTRRENGTTLTDSPFFVSVRGTTPEEVEALWAKLADDATIVENFGPAQWTPGFGMLTDRFGVTWILDVETGGH